MMIPLWKQLQSTAAVVQAVQAGTSGTAAIAAVDAQLRPGVQALSFHVWRWLGTAQTLRSLLAKRAPSPEVDALLCVALALMCFDAPVFRMNLQTTLKPLKHLNMRPSRWSIKPLKRLNAIPKPKEAVRLSTPACDAICERKMP